MRACEKTQTTAVNFQRLVNGKLHREVGGGFRIFLVEFVWKKFGEVDHSENCIEPKRSESASIDLYQISNETYNGQVQTIDDCLTS